jgi:hypothetical protein
MSNLRNVPKCSEQAKSIHDTFSRHGLLLYSMYKLKIISAKEYYVMCNMFQMGIYDAIINGDSHVAD